ncbi:MAG TPA: DUF6597 domain-containing transcriptional factor [Chitinophaga sp.]|uniref:DUF6597 domain-containing transcriptional factor n=1 Tax=Chitinophaga sp. TaxID=1869181 RepID=UPI002C30C5C5|nr:DUF6597 domain-containing transcriptional factor [Chitinophaga sp.]HVI45705.1 DUF6597 domain-containing transcriptional factor [Chitinophaga sp.]
MRYFRINPPAELAGYVNYFWIGEAATDGKNDFTHFSTASSSSRIVFHYKGSFQEVNSAGTHARPFASGLQGQSGTYTRFRSPHPPPQKPIACVHYSSCRKHQEITWPDEHTGIIKTGTLVTKAV